MENTKCMLLGLKQQKRHVGYFYVRGSVPLPDLMNVVMVICYNHICIKVTHVLHCFSQRSKERDDLIRVKNANKPNKN